MFKAWKENAALVEFLYLHNPKRWQLTKDPKFWRATAVFIQQRSESGTETTQVTSDTTMYLCVYLTTYRNKSIITAIARRARVSVKLCCQFSAPEKADVYFQKRG